MKAARILALALLLGVPSLGTRAAAEEPLVVGYLPTKACVALFVAKEQGFFQKHGLNVELRAGQNGAHEAEAILTGAMILGCSGTPTLIQAKSKGVGLIGVAGSTVAMPDDKSAALVVRPDSGISSAADLVGKKVAVSGLGSNFNIIVNSWLMSQHVDFKRVNFFEMPFSAMYDALKRGTVDAALSATPVLTRILSDRTGTPLLFLESAMPAGTPLGVYVGSTEWTAKNPALLKALRAAIAEATAFTEQHRDIADQYISKYLNQPLADVQAAGYEKLDSTISTKRFSWWVNAMRAQGFIPSDPGEIVAP